MVDEKAINNSKNSLKKANKIKISNFFVIIVVLLILVGIMFIVNLTKKRGVTPELNAELKEIDFRYNKFAEMAMVQAKELSRKYSGLSEQMELKMACEAVLNLNYSICENRILTDSIKTICEQFTLSRMVSTLDCGGFDKKKARFNFDTPIDEEVCRKIASGSCNGLDKEKENPCKIIL